MLARLREAVLAAEPALPPELVRQHRIRRYGFHGISYHYVSTRAAELLGRPLSELRLIVFHLGNGASACAIAGGRSVDTSMGMTPLAGLVMGTRAGDVDPGVLIALGRAGLGWDALEELLTRESGLRALAGTEDMRDIHAAAVAGDPVATAALDDQSVQAARQVAVGAGLEAVFVFLLQVSLEQVRFDLLAERGGQFGQMCVGKIQQVAQAA